jgi:hypothetical protein
MSAVESLVEWPPDEVRDLEAEINRAFVVFELQERNADALKAWRWRQAMAELAPALQGVLMNGVLHLPPLYPDACSEAWRSCLELWFERQRDLARRWMFKNRCAKRAVGLPVRPWSRQPLPLMFTRQAE